MLVHHALSGSDDEDDSDRAAEDGAMMMRRIPQVQSLRSKVQTWHSTIAPLRHRDAALEVLCKHASQ